LRAILPRSPRASSTSCKALDKLALSKAPLGIFSVISSATWLSMSSSTKAEPERLVLFKVACIGNNVAPFGFRLGSKIETCLTLLLHFVMQPSRGCVYPVKHPLGKNALLAPRLPKRCVQLPSHDRLHNALGGFTPMPQLANAAK